MSIANIPHALPTGGTMFRNVVINGGFNVNQRATSSNMTAMCTTAVTIPTQSAFFVADRWIAYRTGLVANGQMALMTLSNGDLPFTTAGVTNFARIGRSSGDTSVANINLVTNLETMNSIPMAAKTVTLSLYCRAGANYSGSTNGAVSVAIGVLIDQNFSINALGAGASILPNSFAATTSWQRISYSYSIPTTTTQVTPVISYTPSGTAGVSDYLDVTGVQLEIASSPTSFELKPFAVEMQLCQRYYLKYLSVILGVAFNANSLYGGSLMFPVQMRGIGPSIDTSTSALSVNNGSSGTPGMMGIGYATTPLSTMIVNTANNWTSGAIVWGNISLTAEI